MTGTRGYFRNGIWVEETESKQEKTAESAGAGEAEPVIDNLVDEARNSVNKAISDIASLSKTLFGTEEGRAHLGRKARDAGERLETAIEEIAEAVEEMAQDVKKRVKK
ncbi:MAG: hypothetical protein APR53_08855 [Methanoculleus sp. SDB]|nr:MAG: hypothetical protein APR53_08855 [Methanoculleus sp. SDB]